MNPTVIILMGVAGAGKTAVGQALALSLGWNFIEGDDYHPPANIEKMSRGDPLTDSDRQPWLARLNRVIESHCRTNQPAVVSCSALKRAYRDRLGVGNEGVGLVYLKAEPELIRIRLENRQGHFMKQNLLASQFESLEEPAVGMVIDGAEPIDQIITKIQMNFNLASQREERSI